MQRPSSPCNVPCRLHLWNIVVLKDNYSFAMTELHITLATIFRRFDFELYGTTREDDIDTARDCFLAETIPGSLGVRAKVVKIYEQ
jgi:hypothetical protein